ncbi:MAG: DUF4278 domain-containing protein [Synechococcales cyanobacterium RU_4_20]|nr:DUF4278 domain-containing protein [Synechococcales cyanobacterium RU_4_20]NJR68163.1 DUF4278 domain-containing protein [Synechococcales cyanobacterium CRU_2_2]
MKLCYRGVTYEYEPQVEVSQEGDVIGRYRGCPLREHLARGGRVLSRLSALLTYRGVPYSS